MEGGTGSIRIGRVPEGEVGEGSARGPTGDGTLTLDAGSGFVEGCARVEVGKGFIERGGIVEAGGAVLVEGMGMGREVG